MPRERIFLAVLDACAPLLLWALHFFGAYVFTAAACAGTLAEASWLGHSAVWTVLVVWSIAALIVAAGLLVRAVRPWHDSDASRRRLMPGARIGCAVLGITGIAWSALPVLLLPACVA